MKGSGKTRVLGLIAHLSYKGKVVVNMSEAVLFRTAHDSTICIDEFERVKGKEKANLRELLNAAYKKGISVERAKKVSGKDGERFEIEKFNVFCPVVMANISGMDEVLIDRSIKCLLERTSKKQIARKLEIWTLNKVIKDIKDKLKYRSEEFTEKSESIENLYEIWNEILSNPDFMADYLKMTPITTLNSPITTLPVLPTMKDDSSVVSVEIGGKLGNQETTQSDSTIHDTNNTNTTNNTHYTNYTNYTLPLFSKDFIKKIMNSSLNGRHLELFFPLFIITDICDDLDNMLRIAERIIKEKKEEDVYENRDISLIEYISKMEDKEEWISNKVVLDGFKEFIEAEDDKWINSRWLGVALTRLNLMKDKKRKGRGVEVILNVQKAREKIKMFK